MRFDGLYAIVAYVLLSPATFCAASENALKMYEARSYTFSGGDYKNEVFNYRLMPPAKVEPGKKYPLVIFLHGAGERGTDNKAQLKYFPEWMAKPEIREKYPCYIFAPQCRAELPPPREGIAARTGQTSADEPPVLKGALWSGGMRLKDGTIRMSEEPSDQMQVVIGIYQKLLKTLPIDRNRIYLTGLSMGGFGSWDLAMRHPDWFAAVAPICSGGDTSQAKKLIDVPVWAVHGAKDNVVVVKFSRDMIEALKAAGGNPKYTEYPEANHDSWTQAYREPDGLLPWMFQQVNSRRCKDE